MFLRKFRLDWSNVIGELFIVIIGVLIALAIGEWNSERLAKAEESDTLSRLISDIEVDLLRFDRRLTSIDQKEESLIRVSSALANDGPQDVTQFLNDIIIGANYGWNQGSAQRATFNDLLASGGLRVISDPDIRALILAYYEEYETEHARIDERETAYPYVTYQLVPRAETTATRFGADEGGVEVGLSDEYRKDRVKAAKDSSLGNHVLAEINLARFIRGVTTALQVQAKDLIKRLKEYQAEID